LSNLPRARAHPRGAPDPAPDTITAQTPYGELVWLTPPVQFLETKGYWKEPLLTVLGAGPRGRRPIAG